jgi:hypothetical protein
MHEDMVDCVAIAGSALTLAVERSMDLKIPPQIALTTLKVLVELNLQKSMDEHQIPKSAHELCDILGVDLDDASEFAHEELEKLIRVWISHAKLKEVIIG